MKKNLLFSALFAMFVMTSQSCSVDNFTNKVIDAAEKYATKQEEKAGKEYGEMTTRNYNLKNFTGVKNDISVYIIYTLADKYGVKIEARKKVFDKLSVKVKDGLLCIDTKNGYSLRNAGRITIYLSAPMLNTIKNDGAMTVEYTKIKAGRMDIDCDGAIDMKGGTIECDDLKMDIDGAAKIKTNILSKGNILIEADGAMTMKGDLKAANNVVFDVDGSGKMEGKVEANDIKIDSDGSVSLKQSFKANYLSILNDGSCAAVFSFNGGEINIKNDGSGKIEATCDCKKVTASNDGYANIVIKGTADITDIRSEGVSKINTSELNKF